MPTRRTDLTIEVVDPARADDTELAEQVATMVCDVYRVAEAGLWLDGTRRTTPEEVSRLIAASELVIVTDDDRLVGSAHVHEVGNGTWSIGMLVAAPDQRSRGIGRELLLFGEQVAREHGDHTAQVELLVPQTWEHPDKVRLAAWYDRAGFRVVGFSSIAETHPHLAPFLATPCDLEIRQKPLGR